MNEPNDISKQKKSEKTRKRILNSAIKLMEKKGYESTTIRDICKEAGISIGTFYLYFQTKNDLFFDIYKSADDYFANTVAIIVTGNTASERILDFFRYYARLNVDTGIELAKILYNPYNSWFIQRRPMQQVLENIVSEGQVTGELIDTTTAAEIVDMLFIFMRGCCYNWCMLEGQYDLELQMVDYLKHVLPAVQKTD
ncbi:MAG: TetR/AcrR family transcriptional regulator [Ignavibacteriales bacterium]